MPPNNKAVFTEGPIAGTLVRLTIPMTFGMIGIVAFNLVDTYFVGKLGTNELAALSFTLPVVLIVQSVALGLGVGASAVISRAIGEGNADQVRRLTTDSLVLAVLVVLGFAVAGLLTIKPVFRLLGAGEEVLPLTARYMRIWYLGVVFVVVPMVGNNAIRATGDVKTPALIMVIAAIVNSGLDPLLIFGIGPFPRLEIEGAAIATVLSRATTLTVALYVLGHRDRMLSRVVPRARQVLDSWRRILYIGLPTAGTRIIVPLAIGFITRIVSAYGTPAVAGYGVSSRIEFFAFTVVVALGSVLMPFVGQNWGACNYGRLRVGARWAEVLALGWGVITFAVLSAAARPIASLFNHNPEVIAAVVTYLRMVSLAYGLQGVLMVSSAALNALNRPLHSSALVLAQMFLFYAPLALLGSRLYGLQGVFGALALSYLLGGFAGHVVLTRVLRAECRPTG
jgi:putative MATE family efflux protein